MNVLVRTSKGLCVTVKVDFEGPTSRLLVHTSTQQFVLPRDEVLEIAWDEYVTETQVTALLAELDLDVSLMNLNAQELVLRMTIRAVELGYNLTLIRKLKTQLDAYGELFIK